MPPHRASAIVMVLSMLAVMSAHASRPTFWQVATQADFLKGEIENLTIDHHGRLALGPAADEVWQTSAPFMWTLGAGPDGTLWAGSGNDGIVFRVDPNGSGSIAFDAPELSVHAVAPAPDGGLFVGTSPEGKIYKVARDGRATPFFDPGEPYIWALHVEPDGTVLAATGGPGVIYRITPDGQGQPVYKTRATHVLSLALDRDGNVLAGTGSPGQILRVDRAGKPFVLLDSPFREISALRFDPDGILYAAALNQQRPNEANRGAPSSSDAPPEASTPSTSVAITAFAFGDLLASADSPFETAVPETSRPPQGAVYRIAPDGLWDTIWQSDEDSPYDITFDTAGGVLIGTGNKGKIFRVSADDDPPSTTLLTRAPAQQVTRFVRDDEGHYYYATANPGKVFRLAGRSADHGTFLSEVRDAGTVARWGVIRWHATTPPGTDVRISTRSGNTSSPDETWSAWSDAYRQADGESIASPSARYLQWKAELIGRKDSPILTSVTAAYLPRNLRPDVTAITVHPPGTVFQKPFSTGEPEIAGFEGRRPEEPASGARLSARASSPPALGRRMYEKGLQTFVWMVNDPDDDDLEYDILYRREGEVGWKVLRRGLEDRIYVWDTNSVSDGRYIVKIVASDSPTNPPSTALAGEGETAALTVDNTPPRVEARGSRQDSRRGVLRFRVRDDHSPLRRVEYATEATDWREIHPIDGLLDSLDEEFELALDEGVQSGILIRATDALNNTATVELGLSDGTSTK